MSSSHGIVPLEELVSLVDSLRSEGKRIVLVRGSFDLFGREDAARIRAARESADVLVATIAASSGTATPWFDAGVRTRIASSLPFFHAVAEEGTTSVENVLHRISADAVIDLDLRIAPHPESRELPGSVLDASERTATSAAARFTPETEAFLRDFRLHYSFSDIESAIEELQKLRVLIIGDAIIDEYHFVHPYGMTLKAPIIAAKFLGEEAYSGGALAVANHVAGFCREVHLVTALGADDSREAFVRASLRPNVSCGFFYRPNAPTTVKRRYLTRFLVQKLFEVGFFDDSPLPDEVDGELRRYLDGIVDRYDLVIAADFGHGLLSRTTIERLCQRAPFLAVSTQLNSVNFGYNVITKYSRADYVCIDELELRLGLRDKISPVEELVVTLAEKVSAATVSVTRGPKGSLTCTRGGERVAVPILSRQVVDTIGAGDAYLSISAPCARLGLPLDLVGFLGNAVGGLAVRIVGNKEPVGPESLRQFIRGIME